MTETTKELPKCRFKIAWKQFKKGAVIQPTGLYRDMLIKNGVVELIEDESVPNAAIAQEKPQSAAVPIETNETPEPIRETVKRGNRRGAHHHSATSVGAVDG